jgi:hypothetical protein
MCVPEISIRPDGKGLVVRSGGIDWDVWKADGFFTAWSGGPQATCSVGFGGTIMEAVEHAMTTVRAASPQGDKK